MRFFCETVKRSFIDKIHFQSRHGNPILQQQAQRVRDIAEKADRFTKKRLLTLAEYYEARALESSCPLRRSMLRLRFPRRRSESTMRVGPIPSLDASPSSPRARRQHHGKILSQTCRICCIQLPSVHHGPVFEFYNVAGGHEKYISSNRFDDFGGHCVRGRHAGRPVQPVHSGTALRFTDL